MATPTLVEVLANVADAVVQIKTPDWNGSGFIIDGENGLVLTNAHVGGDFGGVTAYVQNVGVLDSIGISTDVLGKNNEYKAVYGAVKNMKCHIDPCTRRLLNLAR